jgi:hypothetical protein
MDPALLTCDSYIGVIPRDIHPIIVSFLIGADIREARSIKEVIEKTHVQMPINSPFVARIICSRFKPDDITNALIDAIKTWYPGNTDVVATLLDAGAQINGNCQYTWPVPDPYPVEGLNGRWRSAPIFGALQYPAVLALLIARGANVNQHGILPDIESNNTPLHQAIIESHGIPIPLDPSRKRCVESVKMLLDAGADVDTGNNWTKNTPLHTAVCYHNTEAIELLLERGADRTLRDHFGHAPFDLGATRAYCPNPPDVTRYRNWSHH